MEFKMNPLLMEDLLDDLFKKLTIEDLKICRSVCQLWNKRIVAHLKLFWRDLKIIELYTPYVAKSFIVAMYDSKDKKLFTSFDGSITTISKLCPNFITEYEPKRLDFGITVEPFEMHTKLEELINVLKLSSKNLVQLGITGAIGCLIDLTKNEEEKKLLDFTFLNLETIKCKIFQNVKATPIICKRFGQMLQEIVENSPNLKSIENPGINVTICSLITWSSDMLQKLTKLTINIKLPDVHSEEFENYQDCQDLIKMQNQGLKLKYLDIQYSWNNVLCVPENRRIISDKRALEKFLEGQSESLETLKIKVKYNYQIEMHSVFLKLKKLVLEILHSSFEPQLNLSSQFPQLEVLILNIYPYNSKIIVEWNKFFCGSGLKVHTIELCNNSSNCDGEFRELEMLFPHVVNLQINHPPKNLKYEGFRKFWSKSIKSISILTHQEKLEFLIPFDLKFFKIFSGLQRIDFINRKDKLDTSDVEYWKVDFELLESLKNLKFVKLENLLVDQSDLTELRKKYIVGYTPGKFWNYAIIRLAFDQKMIRLRQN